MLVSRPFFLFFLLFANLFYSTISLAANDALWRVGDKPKWIVEADLSKLNQADLGVESVDYLVSDTQVSLLSKQPHYYRYIRFQVNDSAGVEDNSDLTITFNPDFQRVELHHINIIRGDKSFNRLVIDDIRAVDIEPEQHSKLYSGQKQLQLWLKDVRAGDIVDYSFSVIGENPVFDGHFSHTFGLGWGVPVGITHASIVAHKSRKLSNQLADIDTEVKVNTEGNKVRYSVLIENSPAYYEDGQAPNWDSAYPTWQITSFEDWSQVSNWAESLFKTSAKHSAAFDDWLSELKAKPTKLAIEEAIRFSQQDIRYLGVEIGENSHRPHSPSEVLANRYGDCKDKSLLLVSALNELGVDAYPVLVSSYKHNTLAEHLPGYNAFNHAIVYLNYKGQDYWVDPTNAYQSNLLETIVPAAFGQALVISPDNQGLSSIPDFVAEDNLVEVTQEFFASDFRSPVQLTVVNTFTGAEADRMRYEIAGQSAKRMTKSYLSYYQRFYPSISLKQDLQISDDKISNRIEIKEHYLVNEFWHEAEGDAEFVLVSDAVEHYLKVPQKIQRKQPYSLGRPINIQQQAKLYLPYDIDFSWANEEQTLEDEHFKLYTRFDYRNKVITYQQQYQNKQMAVAASEVKQYAKLMRKARKALEINYSVTRVTEDQAYDSMNELVSFLLEKQTNNQQEAL